MFFKQRKGVPGMHKIFARMHENFARMHKATNLVRGEPVLKRFSG